MYIYGVRQRVCQKLTGKGRYHSKQRKSTFLNTSPEMNVYDIVSNHQPHWHTPRGTPCIYCKCKTKTRNELLIYHIIFVNFNALVLNFLQTKKKENECLKKTKIFYT